MKITKISAHQVDLPLKEGRYAWSGGNAVEVFDATVVAVETDAGITGYGECTPLGSAYLPAYAAGVRSGLKELAPKLIGLDPRELGVLNRRMDEALRGHPYVKSPLDVACWDILGKATSLPVVTLLGGKQSQDVRLYRAISQESPERMAAKVAGYRKEGYRKFQLKAGGRADDDIARIKACRAVLEPGDVLVADSNTGWTLHEAARVVNGVKDVDVYIEQPCRTYEECLSIRRRTSLPFVLDENIDGIDVLMRGIADKAFDVINLKISKVGGLTKARPIRTGRASRPVDTRGVPVLGHRLQQLRHEGHRHGRAQARERGYADQRQAGVGLRADFRCAGTAGAVRWLMPGTSKF